MGTNQSRVNRDRTVPQRLNRAVTLQYMLKCVRSQTSMASLICRRRRKFRVALVKVRDLQSIVKLFKLVCNPQFRSDAVLRDIMVDKVAKHNSLLDCTEVEKILHENGELALAIAKRMRLK